MSDGLPAPINPNQRVHQGFSEQLSSIARRATWEMPEADGTSVTFSRQRIGIMMGGVSVERQIERKDNSRVDANLAAHRQGIEMTRTEGALLQSPFTVGSGFNSLASAPQLYFGASDTFAHEWLQGKFGADIENPSALEGIVHKAYADPHKFEGLALTSVAHTQKTLQWEAWRSNLYTISTEGWTVYGGKVRHRFGGFLLRFTRSWVLSEGPYHISQQMKMSELGKAEHSTEGDNEMNDFRWMQYIFEPTIPVKPSELSSSHWQSLLSAPLSSDQFWSMRRR